MAQHIETRKLKRAYWHITRGTNKEEREAYRMPSFKPWARPVANSANPTSGYARGWLNRKGLA